MKSWLFSSLSLLLAFATILHAYPVPQMRICIQSVDPNRLPSQCIYCKSRLFPLTVRLCTGNVYLPARMSLNEASCLMATCRKQLPRVPPEPYSLQRPSIFGNLFGGLGASAGGLGAGGGGLGMPGMGGGMGGIPGGMPGGGGGGSGNIGGGGGSGNSGDESVGGFNPNMDSVAEENYEEAESLMAEKPAKVRPPAKFFLGKPTKIYSSIKPMLFG